jgi:hypothetical protein
MRAIVCDRCGKVVLLSDDDRVYAVPNGIVRLLSSEIGDVDLCVECAKELKTALQKNL